MQTVPVPLQTCNFVLLLYGWEFLSLLKNAKLYCSFIADSSSPCKKHATLCFYRIAESSSPCTNLQLCAVKVFHRVPVPVKTLNFLLFQYCREFQSLYKHENLCCYRMAGSSIHCKTCNFVLLSYCRKFQSFYKHAILCSYRIAEISNPCKNMQPCALTVLQTVPLPAQACNVVLFLYCRQFRPCKNL